MKPQEFIPEEQLDESSDTDYNIIRILKEKGYQFLGSGVDQTAFSEPDTGLVLKIFGTQPTSVAVDNQPVFSNDHKMFFKWADFCMKHTDNPFLPKFFGFETFIFNGKTYLQIRQERLHFADQLGYNISHVSNQIRFMDTGSATEEQVIKTLETELPEAYDGLVKKFGEKETAQLFITIFELYKLCQDHGWRWDLHGGNIMVRNNDTPVIVDPWVVNKIEV